MEARKEKRRNPKFLVAYNVDFQGKWQVVTEKKIGLHNHISTTLMVLKQNDEQRILVFST